ncbi:MAG: fructose-bisphosphatase class III, partial [Hydrogenoanaerobacterium sp.]
TTGIAGYTLVYNSWGIKISAHEPFCGVQNAIRNNNDIFSTTVVFDWMESRITIAQTDSGALLAQNIADLKELLLAYKMGEIKEDHSI